MTRVCIGKNADWFEMQTVVDMLHTITSREEEGKSSNEAGMQFSQAIKGCVFKYKTPVVHTTLNALTAAP